MANHCKARESVLGLLAGVAVCSGCIAASNPPEIGVSERGAIEEAGVAISALTAALAAGQVMFGLDQIETMGPLEPEDELETLATMLEERAARELASCATVSRSETTISAAVSEGCELSTGSTVSGTFEATVQTAPAKVALEFSDALVDHRPLAASATVSVIGGDRLGAELAIESEGRTIWAEGSALVVSRQVTLSATALSVVDGEETHLSATDVVYMSANCYPGPGSIVVSQAPVYLTLELDDDTPRSGLAWIRVGGERQAEELPSPRFDCPSQP